MTARRVMSPAEQTWRLREIDRISVARPLLPEERAERDRLHDRIAMRVWRQIQRERSDAIAAREARP